MKKLLALIVCCGCMLNAPGQVKEYIADSMRQIHNLAEYTYVMAQPSQQMNDSDVLKGTTANAFIPYSLAKKSGLHAREYWLRCRIRLASPFVNWQLLLKEENQFDYKATNDVVEIYILDSLSNIIAHAKTGALIPASEKQKGYPAGYNGVLFPSVNDSVITIYAKVKNTEVNESALSYFSIQHSSVPASSTGFKILLPALSAIASIFCVLSLFFFFFIRERAYLFFALYALFLSQHYLILHPDLPFIDLYIPEHPQLVYGFWSLLTMGGFMLFCLFGRYFMNLPKLSRTTDRWYMYFIAVFGSLVVARSVYLMLFRQLLLPDTFVDMPAVVIGIAFFVRFAFFKNILARLFVGGALWLFAFTIVGLIWGNVLPPLLNPWPIAQVGQFLVFTAALAYKVRLNARAKAEADRIKGMDEIKSRFFANISHEFRTPLSLIQGPLQQIEEQSAEKNGTVSIPYRYIRTMRKHTDRLLELVNQLLDLSRLDSGKMKLEIIKADVMQLLKVIASSFESVAERKQIHYHLHISDQAAIAFFDTDKLEKIFTNLLANAFKYTSAGGKVSVTAAIEENKLRITVEDNGPGIAKKELDKVFDRFYQAEGNEEKGSGIGLALVKELVDLYRGQISVNSELGKGSRFRVTLPADHASFHQDEFVYGKLIPSERIFTNSYNDETAVGDAVNPDTNLPLLLLVEDNTDLRHFLREILQPYYQLTEATNGVEGLEKAIAEIPDIIVSDVMMPLKDGFSLAEELKQDERTSHIPIILLTAKAGQQHKLEGLETGADDYLTKPVDAKELLLRAQNLLLQRKLLRKKYAGNIILKPAELAVKSADDVFLQKLVESIEANMEEEDFGVEELARALALSRSQLHRKLIALTGKPASEILRNTRLMRAKELLVQKAFTPSEVAFKVGFNSHTYFSKCFKETFGMSPGEIAE